MYSSSVWSCTCKESWRSACYWNRCGRSSVHVPQVPVLLKLSLHALKIKQVANRYIGQSQRLLVFRVELPGVMLGLPGLVNRYSTVTICGERWGCSVEPAGLGCQHPLKYEHLSCSAIIIWYGYLNWLSFRDLMCWVILLTNCKWRSIPLTNVWCQCSVQLWELQW